VISFSFFFFKHPWRPARFVEGKYRLSLTSVGREVGGPLNERVAFGRSRGDLLELRGRREKGGEKVQLILSKYYLPCLEKGE